MDLHLVQPGYEAFLTKELGAPVSRSGPGWLLAAATGGDLCFSHLALKEPRELTGTSVNALAGAIADHFTESARSERFEGPWPFCVEAAGVPGLSRHADTVAEEVLARIKARMSRVAKLAAAGRPPLGPARGLFVFFDDFKRAFVARDAVAGGQRRMADDPQAPSRSYLKAEEAYGILGREPAAGESVADLGAAPGGWSYSAAKRGAKVWAVDNGPLKGGALHALIEHRAEDAFKFHPPAAADWLFCDMVEDPDRVLELVAGWLERGECRRFVVNLKFGRHDPLRVRDAAARRLGPMCALYRARHLFHDREEITLVGEVLPPVKS